jgi:UDP-GlcNAc:undecaprenyl-phosphate GlcNAc-1-phosphate transferase
MLIQFLPVVAVLVTLLICLRARAIGEAFGVMAIPDGRRKLHSMSTPQLGGVAILSGLAIWLVGNLIAGGGDQAMLLTILLAVGGLGLVGFIDDRHEIPPASRILTLLLFTGIAFTLDPQLMAPVLHWYSFGDVELPAWLYLGLMAVTAVGLVNSVNMADGQNGLVGSMFVAWSLCIAIASSDSTALAGGVLCALSLVFLFFNLQGKIFLGDCGSYGITFALGIMVTQAHARGEIPLEAIIVWFFIPVVDCLRLMITRPLSGRSVFQGSRDHFHHRLIDSLGMKLSVIVYGAAVALSSLAATLEPRFSLVILCLLSGFYFSFAGLSESGRAKAASPQPETLDETNVVSLRDGKRCP